MCLAGTVVASWSLIQEVVGLSSLSYKKIVTEFAEHLENTRTLFFMSQIV